MSQTNYSPADHLNPTQSELLGFIGIYSLLYLFLLFAPSLTDSSNWYLVLADTDSYTRLTRVWSILNGHWEWSGAFPYYNTPYGIELHWTKPLDICLIISTYLVKPFFDLKEALFFGSFFWNPYFLLSATLAFAWGVYPRVGRIGSLFTGTMLMLTPFLIGNAQPNHIDHHILEVLLQSMALALMFRGGYPRLLGIVFALGIWVAIEFGIFVGVSLLILYFTQKDIKETMKFMALALLAFVVIERGPDFLNMTDIQRLSMIHVFMACSGVLALMLSDRQFPNSLIKRILYATVIFMGLCLGYWVLYHPSLQVIDPRIKTIWFDQVDEIHSLYQNGAIDWRFLPILGPTFLAIGYALRRERLYLCPLIIFTVLTVWHIRHAYYLSPYVALMLGLWGGESLRSFLKDQRPYPLLVALFLIQFPSVLTTLPVQFGLAKPVTQSGEGIPKLVDSVKSLLPPESRVFVYPDLEATAMVWHLGVQVVSAPYHQNVAGILDNHFIMNDSGGSEALRRLEKRGIQYVLLPSDLSLPWLKSLDLVLEVKPYRLFRLKNLSKRDT